MAAHEPRLVVSRNQVRDSSIPFEHRRCVAFDLADRPLDVDPERLEMRNEQRPRLGFDGDPGRDDPRGADAWRRRSPRRIATTGAPAARLGRARAGSLRWHGPRPGSRAFLEARLEMSIEKAAHVETDSVRDRSAWPGHYHAARATPRGSSGRIAALQSFRASAWAR